MSRGCPKKPRRCPGMSTIANECGHCIGGRAPRAKGSAANRGAPAKGRQKPRKANFGLGFFTPQLGFPWLLAAEKAKDSQSKPGKANLMSRILRAAPSPRGV